MQFFRQWAVSVCASGIIGTIFSMIAPKGSMDKILKLMISVFLFTSIVAPFLSGEKLDFDLSADGAAQSQDISEDVMWEEANQLTLRTTQKSIENGIGDFLKRHSCAEYKVKVQLHVDENQYVQLDGAELYLTAADSSRGDELKQLTEADFQLPVTIFDIGAYKDESK